MKNLIAALAFFAGVSLAAAQTEAKLEACNRISNSAKRMTCINEAIKPSPVLAPPRQAPLVLLPTPLPLNLDAAVPICDAIVTGLIPGRSLATEDTELSTADELVVMWPNGPAKPPTRCTVNRVTRKVVSFNVNGKVASGTYLAKIERYSILSREMDAGDYAKVVEGAKSALLIGFKDPLSVQYRGLFISTNSLHVLCGEVNAKNSYGGYIGFRRFYATEEPLVTQIEDANDTYPFSQKWPIMCGERRASVE